MEELYAAQEAEILRLRQEVAVLRATDRSLGSQILKSDVPTVDGRDRVMIRARLALPPDSGGGPLLKTWQIVASALALVGVFQTSAQDTAREPTRDELAEITTVYGGRANIGLLAQHRKIALVLSYAYAMDSIRPELDERDMQAIAAFRAASPAARQADAEMANTMWLDLCNSVEAMDAVAIARRIEEMDVAMDAEADSRARDLLERLSGRGRAAMLRAGDVVAPELKGEKIDAVELARRFPEFSKSRVVAACAKALAEAV